MDLETRRFEAADGTRSEAVFSGCGRYRYALSRRWGAAPVQAWIMLNPSTADERANDPTIARCERRARDSGFGGIDIVNLFAYRATDPGELKRCDAPEGPENAHHIRLAARRAGQIVAAWGVHGAHRGQDQKVLGWLGRHALCVLGLTKDGLPRHPLYMPFAATPKAWTSRRRPTR